MSFDMVVAAERSRGIGNGGELPWRLPKDVAHFVTLTRDSGTSAPNAVIMGRVTWDTIPPRYRPLNGRLNIVITRNRSLTVPDGVVVTHSLGSALQIARERADRVFVVGGAEIYAQGLAHPDCRNIYYTRIDADFPCDALFPAFESQFSLTRVLDEAIENGTPYRIELWTRNAS